MKVLVNAASVKEGGPLVVLDQLLSRMHQIRKDIDWIVAIHPSVRQWRKQQWNCAQVEVGNIDSGPLGLLRWYNVALPAAANRHKADLVFSITNYLPFRKLTIPTVLLVQHAGHFSKEFNDLNRQHLRRPDRSTQRVFITHAAKRSGRRRCCRLRSLNSFEKWPACCTRSTVGIVNLRNGK